MEFESQDRILICVVDISLTLLERTTAACLLVGLLACRVNSSSALERAEIIPDVKIFFLLLITFRIRVQRVRLRDRALIYVKFSYGAAVEHRAALHSARDQA